MSNPNLSSKDAGLIYFTLFPTILWSSKTGGGSNSENTQIFEGGKRVPTNIGGPTTVEQVVLTKPYDPIRDRDILSWVAAWDRGIREELTLIVQPTNSAGVPAGKRQMLKGCAKINFKLPDIERGSSEAAMLELTVQPTQLL